MALYDKFFFANIFIEVFKNVKNIKLNRGKSNEFRILY